MEREAPFIVRACSCRSLAERLCIAKVLKVPPFILKARLCNLPSLQKFLNIYDLLLFLCVFGILFESKKLPKPMHQRLRKSSKNPPQHLPKSMPKPPKIEPKTPQNRRLEGVRKKPVFGGRNSPLLGNVLGRPGAVLGTPWARLGAVLGPSRESCGVLGTS